MNDGRILALDVEHYCNGGCSLDESLWVSGLEEVLILQRAVHKMIQLRKYSVFT
jgi:hypothetical protein